MAAQDPDDPGVLILSEFAGAARELRDALLINPYDEAGGAGDGSRVADAGGRTAGTPPGNAGGDAGEQSGTLAGPVRGGFAGMNFVSIDKHQQAITAAGMVACGSGRLGSFGRRRLRRDVLRRRAGNLQCR